MIDEQMVNDILKPRGNVLYYQQTDLLSAETNSERFYQLTLSNQLWLKMFKGIEVLYWSMTSIVIVHQCLQL
jgi:hypothetical protein